MSMAIHVNGEAGVIVGTLLSNLGVTVDGVDIEITDHVQPVFTDTFGPDVPFDEQMMMQSANIHTALVFYDEAILSMLRAQLRSVTTEGQQAIAGTLYGGLGAYYPLGIVSPGEGVPWYFPFARTTGAKRVKVGTRRNIYDMSFFAVPYTGVASSSGLAVLYQHVIPTLKELEERHNAEKKQREQLAANIKKHAEFNKMVRV